MKRFATHTLLVALAALTATAAYAQPDRTGSDVMWARDIGAATISVDGNLNEAVWSQAEMYNLQWNGVHPLPGGGQQFEVNPAGLLEPVDPLAAQIYFLRKGNELYIGLMVQDESIGGDRGFFAGDGLMMTLVRPSDQPATFEDRDDYFESSAVREEMFYGWQHPADTTASGAQVPGIGPRAWSTDFGLTAGQSQNETPRNPEAWEYAAVVNGMANDDFNGGGTFTPDVGYTMEMRIRLDSLGWDLTQPMSRMPLTIALIDRDFDWPNDPNQSSRTRTWWQGRWLNNFNEGMAFIAGDPGVTVSSGATPAYTEPEFIIPNGASQPDVVVDGVLDDLAWTGVDPQFQLKYQMTAAERAAWLPGATVPYYTFYFHPDANPVLDPTVGRFHLFYKGSWLYVGLDTDDQAVNRRQAENNRDGFRITISARDSLKGGLGGALAGIQFDFAIDTTAAGPSAPGFVLTPLNYAATLAMENPDAIQYAASMKGASTAGDPTDIDEGYQIEVGIDLAELGYSLEALTGGTDNRIWLSLNYFDGDDLENEAESYGTRIWTVGERANGATIYGYMDPAALIVSNENGPEVGDELRAFGNVPNPFSAETTLRYSLPRASDVTIEVFDALGRLVRTVNVGAQAAGSQTATLKAAGLSAGVYVYRVRLDDGTSTTGRMLVAR